MCKISKSKKEYNDKEIQAVEKTDEAPLLTPWQKENLEYLKSQGNEAVWHFSPTSDEKEPTENAVLDSDDEIAASDEVKPEEVAQNTYESFADRLPNIKKVRNKRLYRRLTLIITLFFIAILIVVYFVSPLSKLGEITVSGNQTVAKEQIISQSNLKSGEKLWGQFSDREIYERKIERQLPRVKKATIFLNGIHSFNIKVEEYKVVALEALDNLYHPILENGQILSEEMKTPKSGMPIFLNFSDQKIIKSLMNSYNKLPKDIKQNISEIRYAPSKSNKELINLHMKDTNLVIVNISELSEKMAYYNKIASQMNERGTIDMEVGIFSSPTGNEKEKEHTEESAQLTEQN